MITGSTGMTGAGVLCARAAMRTGAGLVYLGVPASLVSIYDTLLEESVTLPLDDLNSGHLSIQSLDQILTRMEQMTVAAIGPGLSVNGEMGELVAGIVEKAQIPLVLDADALNAMAKNVACLAKLKTQAVLTPHPGEMARLAGISKEEVQNNRINVARDFASRWGVVLVLKGARTVVALPDQSIYINPTGNPGMATGGTGDVLTGIIAGMMAQGVKPADAAIAGVYLHGLAGDLAAETLGEHGLIAGDVVSKVPGALKTLISRKLNYNKGVGGK